ncbi:MAG: DUF4352 domain-containing protein [Frankia sp.]|nr:DUF4352 domain-containing protein [Frankia sp.]
MSNQTPPGPPGGGEPAAGNWPASPPAGQDNDWHSAATARVDGGASWAASGQTPGNTPPAQTPPPGGGWPSPGGGQQPAGGYGQGTPPPGTPAPGGWPQTTPYQQGGYDQGGYQQPGYQQPGYPQTGYQQQAPAYGQPGYQAPGYQQQPAYPQQGTPAPWPGQPQQKSNKTAVIVLSVLGAVAAIVIGVVVALAVTGGQGDEVTAPPTPPSALLPPGTEPVATPPPAPGSEATAPAGGGAPPAGGGNPEGCDPLGPPPGAAPAGVLEIGQTATVNGDGDTDISTYQARITLNSVCATTEPVASYGDPPENGSFVVANFTVEMVSGENNVYQLDFFVQTSDGTRYEATYFHDLQDLSADDLRAGQRVTGYVVFDVPPGHNTLYWNPLFAVEPA